MIIILLIAFVFMIYFAGTETAVCSLSSFQRDEILRGARKSVVASLAKFLENPHRILTAILIGNALAVVIASVAVQAASMQVAEKYGLSVSKVSIIASAGLFFLVVFFGEILPESKCQKEPEEIFRVCARAAFKDNGDSVAYSGVSFFHKSHCVFVFRGQAFKDASTDEFSGICGPGGDGISFGKNFKGREKND